MAEFIQDFFTSRQNYPDGNTRIGQLDRLWYDSNTNTIRISDGVTPGGIIVTGGGGAADAWKTLVVAGSPNLVATGEDTLEFVAGTGIHLETNPSSLPFKTLTITATMSPNLDGGFPDTFYGGVPYIDGGYV